MPWPVYSTRFFSGAGGPATRSYTVPAGEVAVIRNVVGFNNTSTAAGIFLVLNNFTIWGYRFPGNLTSADAISFDCRIPATAGETFSIVTTGGSNTGTAASGYLFKA